MLEPGLAQLATEYSGKVAVARYQLMTADMEVTSQRLQERYKVTAYPTVILFVNGREQQRWVMCYDLQEYRPALNAAVKRASYARMLVGY